MLRNSACSKARIRKFGSLPNPGISSSSALMPTFTNSQQPSDHRPRSCGSGAGRIRLGTAEQVLRREAIRMTEFAAEPELAVLILDRD
jgi:hypothetical protein